MFVYQLRLMCACAVCTKIEQNGGSLACSAWRHAKCGWVSSDETEIGCFVHNLPKPHPTDKVYSILCAMHQQSSHKIVRIGWHTTPQQFDMLLSRSMCLNWDAVAKCQATWFRCRRRWRMLQTWMHATEIYFSEIAVCVRGMNKFQCARFGVRRTTCIVRASAPNAIYVVMQTSRNGYSRFFVIRMKSNLKDGDCPFSPPTWIAVYCASLMQCVRLSPKWRFLCFLRLFLHEPDQRHTVPHSMLLKDNVGRALSSRFASLPIIERAHRTPVRHNVIKY